MKLFSVTQSIHHVEYFECDINNVQFDWSDVFMLYMKPLKILPQFKKIISRNITQ